MIQSLFNTIDKIWLSKETMDQLPSGLVDMKLVLLKERFFKQVEDAARFQEEFRSKLYLLNEKSKRLYRPFSSIMMNLIESLEKENSFTEDSGKVIDIQNEMGWICLKIMFTSLAEIPARMLKVVFYTAYSILYNFWNFEIPFAISSSCATSVAAFFEMMRIPYYGLGILLSSIEGVAFDPIRGFAKLEALELELNNHVKKDKDFFSIFKFEQDESKIFETDVGFRLWYSDSKLIHDNHLEANVTNPNIEDVSLFTEMKELTSKQRTTPDVFPLRDYSIHSAKQGTLIALDRMVKTGRKIYAFAFDQFFLAYTTGKKRFMSFFRLGDLAGQ